MRYRGYSAKNRRWRREPDANTRELGCGSFRTRCRFRNSRYPLASLLRGRNGGEALSQFAARASTPPAIACGDSQYSRLAQSVRALVSLLQCLVKAVLVVSGNSLLMHDLSSLTTKHMHPNAWTRDKATSSNPRLCHETSADTLSFYQHVEFEPMHSQLFNCCLIEPTN